MRVFIHPNLVHTYDTEYLFVALRKMSLPSWFRRKIEDELRRRGVLNHNTINTITVSAAIETEVKYNVEKVSDDLFICYNEFDHYFSLTPSCKSNK